MRLVIRNFIPRSSPPRDSHKADLSVDNVHTLWLDKPCTGSSRDGHEDLSKKVPHQSRRGHAVLAAQDHELVLDTRAQPDSTGKRNPYTPVQSRRRPTSQGHAPATRAPE